MKVQLDIDAYKTKFLGGARQYLFFVLFGFPSELNIRATTVSGPMAKALAPFGYGSASNIFPYLVKSTSVPESTFEEIVIPFPGIPYKMAGGRTFGDWTVTFNIDENSDLLQSFHIWHDNIYQVTGSYATSPKYYMVDKMDLFLLDGNGESTQSYELYGVWPKSIGAVALDYASAEIATVDIVFSYQYYLVKQAPSAPAIKAIGDSLLNKITGSAMPSLVNKLNLFR